MGCKFCYTAKLGFKRNLEPFEIIAQILSAKYQILKNNLKLTNLVFMGMGEPLDNFDNFKKALAIIYDKYGLNYSYRKVTVSTVGIIDKMIQLGNDFDINLAVSLHCADNKKRSELIPVNKKYPLAKLIEACKKFPAKNRQRITFEYILIENFNDSVDDAKNLVKILSNVKSKVNLIKFNPFPGAEINPPSMDKIKKFQEYLIKKGYTATLRKSKGDDILAACGQLSGKLTNK
jgi:23S rRNA (adenine2503-C2)-methyltransferase